MKTLFAQQIKNQFTWCRIVMFSVFLSLTGICSIYVKGQEWINKYDENYWTDGGRYGHAMAYLKANKILFFGGMGGGNWDDTRVYDLGGSFWQQLFLSTRPTYRSFHAMAYIGNNKVLLFGGINAYVATYSDTWLFDGNSNTWALLSPTSHPSARFGHAMTYMGDDKVLLFGGSEGGSNVKNDTWIFDLSDNTWTQMYPTTSPSQRDKCSVARLGNGKAIIFGGTNGVADTWIYDLGTNTWTLMNPVQSPASRYGHGMAFLGGGKSILYGGYNGSVLGDTWIYDLNNNTWSQFSSTNNPPSVLELALAETQVDGGNVVLFGGSRNWLRDDLSQQTWEFKTIIDAITLISPNGGENWQVGSNHNITWTSSGTIGYVTITYSTDNGSNWTTIFSAAPDNGSYPWAIPNSPSTNCLIRIRDSSTGSPNDISNAVFTISTPCTLAVDPSNQNVPYSPAGSTTFSVTSNCSWTAVSNQTWCTVTSSGTGNGTITANYSVNTSSASRTANITVTVAGLTPVVVTVTQAAAPCTLVVAPSNQNVPYSPAGSTTFSVTSNCSWTAVSNQTWCTVTSSGTGNGTITANYSVNTSSASRTANITVTVAGLSPVVVTVTQAAAPCTLVVAPSNQNVPYSPAGSTTFSVTSNCSWTAVSNQTWCSVTSSGSGNGTITANYSVNTLTASRTANITVSVTGLSPVVVTVTQAAVPCTLVVSPSNQNVPYSPAGSTTFSVTSNCSWTAVSNQTWCSVTSSGSGNGTITANYSVNSLTARSANITVSVTGLSPVVVTVTQAPAPCTTLMVAPPNQNVPYSPAGSTTFSVTSNCSWTAVSNQTWCTVTSSGIGNGTITATYYLNESGAPRMANITVTVSGLSPVEITLTQLAPPSQHFIPVWWPGYGMDHMNLYALTAKLDGIDLQPGDEIGIFDGDVCVGVGVLSEILTGSNYLECLVSRDDPGTPAIDGYTAGNAISFKVYDSSEGSGFSNTLVAYVSGEGVFNPGATALFNLTALTSEAQPISLTTGWNILSFAVEPDNMSLMAIVQPLITDGTLIKVQDEYGHAIERLPDPIGWLDNIGQMSLTEGYKIKVTSSTILNITGRPRSSLYTIPLNTGWNIAGYPFSASQSALLIFQPLIDEGSLIKVQDEMGHAIEKLPDPIGWIDNIHNLLPGKGYKVKTSLSTTLTLNNPSKGEYKAEEVVMNKPSHFTLTYTGNGLDQMNIYLKNPIFDGGSLKTGDEIGVFDGVRCVGAVVVDELNKEYLPVIVSLDDPTTPQADGFTEGNRFELRLWDKQSGKERKTQKVEIFTGYSNLFEKLGTSVLSADFEKIISESILDDAYPNPSSDMTTFTFRLSGECKVHLEIINVMGDVVRILVDQVLPGGSHKVEWDNCSEDGKKVGAGVYFYRIRLDSILQTKKLVIH